MSETEALTPEVVEANAVIEAEIVNSLDSVTGLTPVQDADDLVPIRPADLTAEEEAEIKKQVEDFIEKVRGNPSDWTLADIVFDLGSDAVSMNSTSIGLMDRKMGDVLKDITVGSPVERSLVAIKVELDKVNPAVVKNTPIIYKVALFLSRTRLPKADELLRIIAERRETVSSTINGLKEGLWAERDKVLDDASELMTIADGLKDTQSGLQRAIYFGQMLWNRLKEVAGDMGDPVAATSVTNLISDLSMQVVDLQTIDNLNLQSRAGAEQLIRNGRHIQNNIRRITTFLTSAVATALAVRAAAAQQASTMRVMQDIRQSVSKTMEDTAKSIRSSSKEAAEMQQKTLVDMDGLERACNDYIAMFEEQDEIRKKTEAIARETSKRVGKLSDTLRGRVDALTNARQKTGQKS